MVDLHSPRDGLIVTAFWEARPSDAAAVASIVREYLPQAQREPWVLVFQEAGFASHQETPHFKAPIIGQALPKLANRERTQYRFVPSGAWGAGRSVRTPPDPPTFVA